METKMKLARLRYFLLALVMVAGMMSAMRMTASAYSGSGTEAAPYIVTDYDELRDLMLNTPKYATRYIKLGSNIRYSASTTDHALDLSNDYASVVLDLNGYTLSWSGTATDTAIVKLSTGRFTIRDSSSAGTGKMTNGLSNGNALYVTASGVLIIEGGTFEVTQGQSPNALYALGGTTLIKGGTFVNAARKGGAVAHFSSGKVTVDGGTFLMKSSSTVQNSTGIYCYPYSSGLTVTLCSCTIIGGDQILSLGKNKIPDGCYMYDTTIGGQAAVVVAPKEGSSITTLSATVTKPMNGATPVFSANAGGDNYTATVSTWYKGGAVEYPISGVVSADDTFVGGNTYVVQVTFTPKEGYVMRADTSATINGVEAYYCASKSKGGSVVYRVALTAPTDIAKVTLTSDQTVTTPGIGWEATKPNFTVTEGKPVYVKSSCWEKYDDTKSTWVTYSGTTFEEGKYRYMVFLYINSKDRENYLMNNGVAVTVNGESWDVINKVTWEDSDKLMACWAYSPEYTAAKKYRVSFNANGGTGTMGDDIVLSGKASLYYRLPENGFTAPEGKYFKGWGTSPNSTRVASPSTRYPIGSDKTFYAIWGDITYIDTVDVKITEPVAGANPQDGVSNTAGVSVSKTEWYCNGVQMSASDTFAEGYTYKVHVTVKKDVNCEYTDSLTVTFNGSTAGTVYTKLEDSLNYYADFTIPVTSARDRIIGFVTRMYQQCLSREPDEAGLAGWVEQLESGQMNGAQIAEAFVFSNEMLNKNLSHEEFVKVLYRAMMGREADADGLAGWMKELTNDYSTRSEVTKAFVDSAEFTAICESYGIIRGDYAAVGDIERFVTGFYTKCLGRPADAAGHWGWVKQLQQKNLNGAQIAEAFFFSEEFVNKNVSDEVYIATLYRTILGREADAEGLAGWVGQLQSSQMTRREILGAFIESDEFTKLCARYGIERGSL